MNIEAVVACAVALGIAAVPGCSDEGGAGCGYDCRGPTDGGGCRSDSECPPTHTCSAGVCYCQSTRCPPRQECVSGECRSVECGIYTRCASDAGICDTFTRLCYPENGRCAKNSDCPIFGSAPLQAGDITCDGNSGFCKIKAPAPARPGGFDTASDLALVHPTNGEFFPTVDDVVIEWPPQRSPVIILLLTRNLAVSSDLVQGAIWGGFVATDRTPRIRWAEGARIHDGMWTSNPGVPPENTTLFAVVEAVDGDSLTAVSPLVPFRVGQGDWPARGASCTNEGIAPGGCFHPAEPRGCVHGLCRRLCASSLDCEDGQCGLPVRGLRGCE